MTSSDGRHEYALVCTCERTARATLPDGDRLGAALRALPTPRDCGPFDLFLPHPEQARLTLFGDGEPPFVIVECGGRNAQALQRRMEDPALRAVLRDAGVDRPPGAGDTAAAARWRAGIFRVEREPVPSPRADDAAPVSLVVHYHGPVDDAAGFVSHYVANHPPILARLPGVREVLCYVPIEATLAGLPPDPTVIRNEVRFDSMDALLAALASPVLAELRADSGSFPRFGRSTHYPMQRRPVGR